MAVFATGCECGVPGTAASAIPSESATAAGRRWISARMCVSGASFPEATRLQSAMPGVYHPGARPVADPVTSDASRRGVAGHRPTVPHAQEGDTAMSFKMQRVHVYHAEVEDKPGGISARLKKLAEAGAH